MGKERVHLVKLELEAGIAKPVASMSALLGSKGVPAPIFCKQFNEATQSKRGEVCTAVIEVYKDRTFSFEVLPASIPTLLKEKAKIKKGSGEPNRKKVATIKKEKLQEIAKIKQPYTNARSEEAMIKMLAGTARSMGIVVQD